MHDPSLGASHGRLVCRLLTEIFVLRLFGAIAGLLLARACLRLLVTTLPAMRDLACISMPGSSCSAAASPLPRRCCSASCRSG
jgi:hypothetical protein